MLKIFGLSEADLEKQVTFKAREGSGDLATFNVEARVMEMGSALVFCIILGPGTSTLVQISTAQHKPLLRYKKADQHPAAS